MKKTLSLLLVFAMLCSFCLTALPAKAVTAKLNKTKLTLNAGASYILKVKDPSASVKWSSSKKSVASVSKKGKVTAKNAGTATITAKIKNKKLRCKVTVKQKASGKGTKANPKSAYTTTTFDYYEEGKNRGRFSIKLLSFVSGDEAAELAKNNSENLVPEKDQEYIYFKFRICYLSGSQTVNAKDIFNYYYNIYGDNSTRQMRNLDWGFFFEPIDDLGTTILSPGNKVTCGKAILVNKGYDPITFRIQTGKNSYTWFTTER
ncbi:MAG: Ig-like domain-containing protein [Lachnospiraceae bacterium]|nr:Ig-like domain-containing protein [Lachnospiraceae bacterium]MCH5266199.1 Ig-like domain-containing protein [Lachnospiraceae bacterium]